MSESNVIQACPSPFIAVEAWKIPPLDNNITIPPWALSTIMQETGKGGRAYGQLIGCYVVREHSHTKILYASDFHREYLPVHVTFTGAMVASTVDAARRFDAVDYLNRLADWLVRQGNRWEGPDGCDTYETEETAKIAAKLRDFIMRSEGVKSKTHGFVDPFLYLPPTPQVSASVRRGKGPLVTHDDVSITTALRPARTPTSDLLFRMYEIACCNDPKQPILTRVAEHLKEFGYDLSGC